METCKFCRENPANKKNTHYLTDSIIRIALNEGGSNVREKGAMYNISTIKESIEFRFQRSTSQEAIVSALGREAHEDEIEQAMSIPFSVDNVFCASCEDKFTTIEKRFLEDILPKLRGLDFTGVNEKSFDEVLDVKAFFLLQVWRMAVADPSLKVTGDFLDHLRSILFDPNSNVEAIISLPLNVTFLSTIGDEIEFTTNKVGILTDNGVDAIAMNDFVIQFPADGKEINFANLFGINQPDTFTHFANVSKEQFLFKVFDNEGRKVVNANMTQLKVDQMLASFESRFTNEFEKQKGKRPYPMLVKIFISEIINGNRFNDSPRYSDEHVTKVLDYILSNIR